MLKTLTELCHYLHNWFDRGLKKFYGTFIIEEGNITDADFLDAIQNGQYFRIIGSIFNDGVYQYDESKSLNLHDENFVGSIWLMAVPKEVIDLADEIKDWQTQYEAADSANMSPFNSESFGGYSYTKSSGNAVGDKSANANSWQGVFASKLNMWRKKR